jgi:hypothetical protein
MGASWTSCGGWSGEEVDKICQLEIAPVVMKPRTTSDALWRFTNASVTGEAMSTVLP